jgi:tRNA-2-methylthio-N6-dimethylallyladenosine synthase
VAPLTAIRSSISAPGRSDPILPLASPRHAAPIQVPAAAPAIPRTAHRAASWRLRRSRRASSVPTTPPKTRRGIAPRGSSRLGACGSVSPMSSAAVTVVASAAVQGLLSADAGLWWDLVAVRAKAVRPRELRQPVTMPRIVDRIKIDMTLSLNTECSARFERGVRRIGTCPYPGTDMNAANHPDTGPRPPAGSARTYAIRTYGCQMNVHDSERLSGLLEQAGYVRAADQSGKEADLVVFNTCAVRENADNRLYGNLSQLVPAKTARPGMQIAVGGCLAQKDQATVLQKAPWVDVVFGTHNLASLPVLLERARHNAEAQVEIVDSLQNFPSDLPSRRDSAFSAWVSVSVGCDNTCTFCIVPSLRGKEADRRPEQVLAEINALVDKGVTEITLLGQNVNSYGRSFGDSLAFGKLLRACGEIDGLERVRFTSPHPRDFTDDVIAAMAETANVCPQLHMPMQSGSDAVLRSMRRSYRQARYLAIIDEVRAAMPHAAITTDIIVGFPGETEADFRQTMYVVERARFASAFTFQYSLRPGTPAATMPDQIPKGVVQERYDRLIELQDQISWDENKTLIGADVEVLVSASEGKKDSANGRLSGRARDGRLVHVNAADLPARPGDLLTATVSYAAPHHLVADGGVTAHRVWRGPSATTHSSLAPAPALLSIGRRPV